MQIFETDLFKDYFLAQKEKKITTAKCMVVQSALS